MAVGIGCTRCTMWIYKDIAEKYMKEARKIDQYRVECKDEAFQMFSRWFYALWD